MKPTKGSKMITAPKPIRLRPMAELMEEIKNLEIYLDKLNKYRHLVEQTNHTQKTPEGIMSEITEIVCGVRKITKPELFRGRASQHISDARFIIFHIATTHTRLSTSAIGRYFDMDHGAVSHGQKRAKELCSTDKHFDASWRASESLFLKSQETKTTNKPKQ